VVQLFSDEEIFCGNWNYLQILKLFTIEIWIFDFTLLIDIGILLRFWKFLFTLTVFYKIETKILKIFLFFKNLKKYFFLFFKKI